LKKSKTKWTQIRKNFKIIIIFYFYFFWKSQISKRKEEETNKQGRRRRRRRRRGPTTKYGGSPGFPASSSQLFKGSSTEWKFPFKRDPKKTILKTPLPKVPPKTLKKNEIKKKKHHFTECKFSLTKRPPKIQLATKKKRKGKLGVKLRTRYDPNNELSGAELSLA
jgi:hypothetical protein